MRTSREWIDATMAELEGSAIWSAERETGCQPAEAHPDAPGRLTLDLILSPEELQTLDGICREDELTPKQALTHIIRARLLGRPQFGRSDRARLRACLDLLRALEQHVGRAARPAKGRGQTATVVSARTAELLDLGAYLRRVGRAIGESMTGNLRYWQADPVAPAGAFDEAPRDETVAAGPTPRTDSSGSW
jgi:hypothetical protein